MKKYNCPSCGAEVLFQSSLSVYAVCRYCSSMIVRHDVDVESIGTMAALPDDMSPLQIGTGGIYKGRLFGIIGRMKIGWEDGFWNEWFLVMDDGQKGWLAEAQGVYAISFEIDEPLDPKTEDDLNRRVDSFQDGSQKKRPALGSYLTLNNQKFKVADIKQATCLGSEGELPFTAPQGRKTLSIDLLGSNGEFGSIELLDGKQRIYLGDYVEWDEMHCQNLRALEGW
jgi:DNA-directed RNA polymerase subunit RPC12/RpoP